MTEAYLTGLVDRLQPGVTEIYCHPGLSADPELTRWAPQYRRQEELAALLSPHLKATLAAAGVRRTDFRELAGKVQGSRFKVQGYAHHEPLIIYRWPKTHEELPPPARPAAGLTPRASGLTV